MQIIVLPLLLLVCAISSAFALNQTFTGKAVFVVPLSIAKLTPADFGMLEPWLAGKYVLDTQENLSTVSGKIIDKASKPARLILTGSPAQSMTISVSQYKEHNNVMPSLATCSYKDASEVECNDLVNVSPPGIKVPLTIGLTIGTSAASAPGIAANPSFLMTIIYN